MNSNFKVIGLSRLGITPESTAPEADALSTLPSELVFVVQHEVLLTYNACSMCVSGRWNCTTNECAALCHVIGEDHYITFDGRMYQVRNDVIDC